VFRNILVAIDGSRSAEPALVEAIDLAQSDGARLVLMSVAVPARWRFCAPPYAPYPTEEDLEREARAVVERAAELVPTDVSVSIVVAVGPPAEAILGQAGAGRHDLILMGSHRRGPVGTLVLGSVSREVIARSAVPVLIARHRREESPRLVESGPPREERAGRSTAGASIQAQPTTRGQPVVFLWLVAALLLELELVWWMFNRMYEP
jgi:nucleotide-binding universal stress UspA family protein